MTTKTTTALLFSTLLAATAAPAVADSDGSFDRPMAPANDMFEIAIGGSFMQPAGRTGIGDASDIAGPGGGAELQLGYRITPNLLLGGYGTLEGYSAGDMLGEKANDVGGASLGFKADWHFRPARSVDPWISLGGGMRWLVVDDRNQDTIKLRGVDLARVQLGVDYRFSRGFAISPVINATATTYLDQDTGMTSGYADIADKKVSWMFGGGLLGRFDL